MARAAKRKFVIIERAKLLNAMRALDGLRARIKELSEPASSVNVGRLSALLGDWVDEEEKKVRESTEAYEAATEFLKETPPGPEGKEQ